MPLLITLNYGFAQNLVKLIPREHLQCQASFYDSIPIARMLTDRFIGMLISQNLLLPKCYY